VYRILHREDFSPQIHLFKIDAPQVARKAQAGQFVVIRIDEAGERIPLTIADWDTQEGSVTIVFMEVGATTRRLAKLGTGDFIVNFVGPLGNPTHIEKFGNVICVGGGFAIAVIMPIAREMKRKGNNVHSIIGARTRDLIFWEDRMREGSDGLTVTTDDGSYGRKALVTEPLREMLESGVKYDRVIAIGPTMMMKFVAETTRPFGVTTVVSLNPIMVDGTGMCGCCRVEVGGETKFACVDGPDFDAHQVDWELLQARQRAYVTEEKQALEHFCQCEGGQTPS
jgi:ferredoxin--NADP+ reductase